MKVTVGQVAALLQGEVEGDNDIVLTGFDRIESAQTGQLTFLANPKYEPELYRTGASAVLVHHDFQPQEAVAAALIRVADPYASLATLMQMVQREQTEQAPKGIAPEAYVHPSAQLSEDCYVAPFAYIGENAQLGAGCRVYPYAYVGDGCRLGDHCILYPHATLYPGIHVGARSILHAGCVVGADGFGFAPTPQGYEKIPQTGIVELGENVEVGANTCIDRAVFGATKVADGVKLDNLVQIAHNCQVGAHTVMAAQAGLAGSSQLGEWCRLGGQVGIAGHVQVGNHVDMGGKTGVLGNVESHKTLLGSPAMDAGQAMRTFAALKQLPQLLRRVQQLEKHITNAQ